MSEYIWNLSNWPNFTWNHDVVMSKYMVFNQQKALTAMMFSALMPQSRKIIFAETIAHDAVASSDLEGVAVSYDSVYSSIAKMLELDVPKSSHSDRNSHALAEILKDASSIKLSDFSQDRMLFWHKRLFEGLAGNAKPKLVGEFRKGPVYVVRY